MTRVPATRSTFLLAPLLAASWACAGGGPAPAAAPGGAATKLVVTRIDTQDAELRAALADRATAALPACDAHAGAGPRGHLELSVEVDAAGRTVAGILHTTLGNDHLTECVARSLTGVAMPARGTSYRARIRLEGR